MASFGARKPCLPRPLKISLALLVTNQNYRQSISMTVRRKEARTTSRTSWIKGCAVYGRQALDGLGSLAGKWNELNCRVSLLIEGVDTIQAQPLCLTYKRRRSLDLVPLLKFLE